MIVTQLKLPIIQSNLLFFNQICFLELFGSANKILKCECDHSFCFSFSRLEDISFLKMGTGTKISDLAF